MRGTRPGIVGPGGPIAITSAELAERIDDAEYRRLLQQHGELDGQLAQIAAESRSWLAAHARPGIWLQRIEVEGIQGQNVQLSGRISLIGWTLASALENAHAVVAMAATVGPEVDRRVAELWEHRPDAAWALDRLAAAGAEHLIAHVGATLCQEHEPEGISVLPPLSPGCAGWRIEDLPTIFSAVASAHPDLGVALTEEGALRPKASVVAMYGLTRAETAWEADPAVRSCRHCHLQHCDYRRTAR